LFLGLLGNRKGIFDLLPAFKQASEEMPNLRLRIGGNGDVDATRVCVRTLGLENSVCLLGWISGSVKDQELHRADIFVLPSYNEGLPMSVLEAMAWGLPVVTTPVGGIPELIENRVDGLLVRPGDIGDLREALVSLAADRALRHRLGCNARERVERNHSAAQVLTALESVYAELRS
jgi:glycosyltransferase involved in cell wall biosynthesis